jgi:hypothetical protein
MRLDEGRCRCGESGRIRQRDVGRVPARAGTDAVGMLERCEKFMAQERIASAPERIPLSRVELIDAVVNPGSWRRLRQECFSMSRVSR